MITIQEIAHHRNGVSGNSFYAVLFTDEEGDRKVATVFPEPGNVAVLSLGLLGETPTVSFGLNSWRGDFYEPELRAAIARHLVDPVMVPA